MNCYIDLGYVAPVLPCIALRYVARSIGMQVPNIQTRGANIVMKDTSVSKDSIWVMVMQSQSNSKYGHKNFQYFIFKLLQGFDVKKVFSCIELPKCQYLVQIPKY